VDDSWGTAISLSQLGLVRWKRGDLLQAAEAFDVALDLFARIGSTQRVADMLSRIAVLAVTCGQADTAVRLFSESETLRNRIGAVQALPERDVYETSERNARALQNEPAMASGPVDSPERSLTNVVSEAHGMLQDIAIACAREDLMASLPGPALTSRELDVLRLIASGKTNQEIADELFISIRTVTTHTTAIFTRLGVGSRTAAVDTARRRGLI
jgi:DNA-binding NarL/FixJ family response regulator